MKKIGIKSGIGWERSELRNDRRTEGECNMGHSRAVVNCNQIENTCLITKVDGIIKIRMISVNFENCNRWHLQSQLDNSLICTCHSILMS